MISLLPLRRPLRGAAKVLTVTIAVAVSAAGCSASGDAGSAPLTGPVSSGTPVFPAAEVQPLVDAVVHRTVKPLPTSRLAAGVVPPTNRWFSGLVFGDKPQPVFPLPLSFGLTDRGFAFGQPVVTATEKTIAGGFRPDVTVDTGADRAQVSAYDTATVTVDGLDSTGDVLGRTVIAQGSPLVSYTAVQAGQVSTALPFVKTGDFWTATVAGVAYGLVTKGSVTGGSVTASTIELDKGATATWFVIPADGSAEKLAALAEHPITGSSLGYGLNDTSASTQLTYLTGGSKATGDTAFAAMPHQQQNLAAGATCDLGSYPSIYGTMKLCAGQTLDWTAPLTQPTTALDLSSVTAAQRTTLVTQVERDAAQLPDFPADTYFGGKALYRAAMIYQLAVQLGADDAAAAVKTRLTETLGMWTEPQGCAQREAFCFVYDEEAKGLVGLTPSFGSEEFNDHHFHYGYFLFAAGVLAADDPALTARYAPVMNLLAADIASSGSSGAFPDQRAFDVYASHSWASGTSPFADGNNQESSSEATNAWTGLALWGKAIGNAALTTEATWMLSSEAQSTLAYWTNIDLSQPAYTGFSHQVVSLNWGGKRDYATWFSPEPAAILGIQVIPMGPSSTYLAGDSARIEANVAEATGGNYNQKFGDYLLMYAALAGEDQRNAALATAEKLGAQWIDDGNSRSYLLAWLMTSQS